MQVRIAHHLPRHLLRFVVVHEFLIEFLVIGGRKVLHADIFEELGSVLNRLLAFAVRAEGLEDLLVAFLNILPARNIVIVSLLLLCRPLVVDDEAATAAQAIDDDWIVVLYEFVAQDVLLRPHLTQIVRDHRITVHAYMARLDALSCRQSWYGGHRGQFHRFSVALVGLRQALLGLSLVRVYATSVVLVRVVLLLTWCRRLHGHRCLCEQV